MDLFQSQRDDEAAVEATPGLLRAVLHTLASSFWSRFWAKVEVILSDLVRLT